MVWAGVGQEGVGVVVAKNSRSLPSKQVRFALLGLRQECKTLTSRCTSNNKAAKN